MDGWRSDRQTTRGLEVRRGLRGGLAEKRRRITTRGGVNQKKKKGSQEIEGGAGAGVGYPACRQHGTGEGAAAFLLAVQEPEGSRERLRERQGSGAPLHRLLVRPGGGSLSRTHPEVLQFQRDAPGLRPWPFPNAVRRQSQGDGPQGERRVQQARLENLLLGSSFCRVRQRLADECVGFWGLVVEAKM